MRGLGMEVEKGGSLNVVVGFALFKRQHLNKT